MPRRRRPRHVREQMIAEQVAAEREAEMAPKPLRLRTGGDSYSPGPKNQHEEASERILADGRRGVKSMAEKTDYLTNEQYRLRWGKEVFNSNGVPDASLMSGLYRRAYNPEFGNRPGSAGKQSDD